MSEATIHRSESKVVFSDDRPRFEDLLGHRTLRGHRILTANPLLLLLHVLLVGHLLLLFGRDVMGNASTSAARHVGLRSCNLGMADVLG